jgi:cell division protein FtsB
MSEVSIKLDDLIEAVEGLSVADATSLYSAVQARIQDARKEEAEKKLEECKQNGKYESLKKEVDALAEKVNELDETFKVSHDVKIDITAECSAQSLHHALIYGGDELVSANYTAKVNGITNRNLRSMFQDHLNETLEGACMDFFKAAFPEQSKELAKLQAKVEALREKIRASGIPVEVFFEDDE